MLNEEFPWKERAKRDRIPAWMGKKRKDKPGKSCLIREEKNDRSSRNDVVCTIIASTKYR